jgi:hypothetical protein
MKQFLSLIAVSISIPLAGCHSERRPPQPGLYNTQAEAQAEASKVNALTQRERAQAKALGVHEQYLVCGTAKPVRAANDYWLVETDKSGCPATAGQEDPHPELLQQSPKPKAGGNRP